MTPSPSDLLGEYGALRHGVGAHRLPVDVVSVSGPEASGFLQGQLSQDIEPLEVGASSPALLLEPDGKLSTLLRVTRTAADAYTLDTDAGWGDAVLARLTKFKLRTKVGIEALEWPCVALRGEGAARTGATAGGPPYALAVEWNGTRGVDILGPCADTAVPEGAVWCGAAAWEALRIEAGIPKMGAELDGRTIAAEAGLVERTVSFTKGCYTGQELVARLDARGSNVARRLCGVVTVALGPGEAHLLHGATLWVPGGDKPVGRCTSAAWCPGVESVAGLAYLHRSVQVPADIEWIADGEGQETARRAARAVAPPIVAG